LFVHANTFLPVFVPFAPVSSVLARFPSTLAEVLHHLQIDHRFIQAVVEEMGEPVLAKTASRQVLGVMNEFTFMAEHSTSSRAVESGDLVALSCWLADTIVGPLTKNDLYTPIGALLQHVDMAAMGP
jgi:hypothetical protein